ncbi:hypothetical protein SPWS13_2113 [Shewanella putrefaciens]|nr:hypothetical protein SPWS13_2113 [Shewanella putrefaciens]
MISVLAVNPKRVMPVPSFDANNTINLLLLDFVVSLLK